MLAGTHCKRCRTLSPAASISSLALATIPRTPILPKASTVARLASIPHGTTALAQGTRRREWPPRFSDASITPLITAIRHERSRFESTLANATPFRSVSNANITQLIVNDPNFCYCRDNGFRHHQNHHVERGNDRAVLDQRCEPGCHMFLRFIDGYPRSLLASMTRHVLDRAGSGSGGQLVFLQLQYTQTVLLNFNGGLSWPHVSVATLRKA